MTRLQGPESGREERLTEMIRRYKDVDKEVELIIPDQIDGYPVTAIGNCAISECQCLISIILTECLRGCEQVAVCSAQKPNY